MDLKWSRWILLCGLAACDAVVGAHAAPTVVATSLDVDADRVAPTATIVVELSQPPDGDSLADALVVARGLPTAELLHDAETTPISADHRAALVAGRLSVDGSTLR